MIKRKQEFVIDTNSTLSQSKFTLKEENLAHIFGILRNNLYSNKILAVIREYSTNAIDANEKANSQKPIEITIPTAFSPIFSVRDFGEGLSEDDIYNVFSSYGESTKRNSNKFVGTLGIGSKSGFSYANSFTVTSYHGGMKKVYEAFIDESEIGTIAKLIEEPSDEPTGVLITIAVNKNDIYTFKHECEKFFLWWDVKPIFHGDTLSFYSPNTLEFKSELGIISFKSGYYNNSPELYVKMGNIVYPVTSLDKTNFVDLMPKNYHVLLTVNIGEVSFSTSRESLEMNDHTVTTINNYLEKLCQQVVGKFQDKIDDCASPWEALRCYLQLPSLIKKINSKKLIWRNKEIPTNLPNNFEYCVKDSYNHKWYARSFPKLDQIDIVLIVNDGGFPTSQLRTRLNKAHAEITARKTNKMIVFARGSIADAQHLINNDNYQGLEMVKLSSVMPIKPKSKNGLHNDSDNVFLWNGQKIFPYSNCWDSAQPKQDMICVQINKFVPKNYTFDKLKDIKSIASILFEEDLEIYGVKTSFINSPSQLKNKSYLSLDEYLIEKSLEILSDKSFVEAYITKKIYTRVLSSQIIFIMFLQNHTKYNSKCSRFSNLISYHDNSQCKNYDHKYKFLMFCAENFKDVRLELNKLEVQLESEINKYQSDIDYCKENYPILNHFCSHRYTGALKDLVCYVDSILLKSNIEKRRSKATTFKKTC